MKKTLTLYILLLFALSSCVAPEVLQQRKCDKAERKYFMKMYKYGCELPYLHDTTIIRQTITNTRDTTIFVKLEGDTVYKSVPLSVSISFLETKYAISKAWVENDSLCHNLVQKQSEIPTTIPDAIKETKATVEKKIPVPYPVTKYIKTPLNWIQKTLMYSGVVMWVSIIAYFIYKIRRLILFKLPFG